jgi:hypothetical protein
MTLLIDPMKIDSELIDACVKSKIDPGVALKSAVYPGQNVVLTMIGNTSSALWSLYREIEGLLGL